MKILDLIFREHLVLL